MFLQLFVVIFIAGKLVSASPYIPPKWTPFCLENVLHLSPQNPTTSLQLDVHCFITKLPHFHWKLNDLRDWTIQKSINNQTTPSNRTVTYNITITCASGANISLPWPMKVAGLQEIHVTFCRLVDRFVNINGTTDIVDDLKVLEIRHSDWIVNETAASLVDSAGNINLSSPFDCGQDSSLETFIASNVSDIIMSDMEQTNQNKVNTNRQDNVDSISRIPTSVSNPRTPVEFIKPEDHIVNVNNTKVINQLRLDQESIHHPTEGPGTSPEGQMHRAQIESLKLMNKMLNARTKCNYSKLRKIDESLAPLTSEHHFDFMVQGAVYPELERMNYSYIGMKELPKPLMEWRVYFPKLQLLDLSYNYIEEVRIPAFPSDGPLVTFLIHNNNISFISIDILNSWAKVENFFVDIRDNPIHCGCELSPLLPYLQNNGTFSGTLAPYEYVRHMRCHSPGELIGRQLYSLTQDSLLCPVFRSSMTSVIVLGVLMATLVVVIVVMIKFKVEIRILLYTRLHIRLPCDADVQRNNKLFDAFVSYSNNDMGWVCENIINLLERSPTNNTSLSNSVNNNNSNTNNLKANSSSRPDNSRASFKLCVHQRDFIPGKTILDNIVDSIEASRHTIIVMSPSFMRSHWAMEELRQAYRQSLVEKTRHLIVVLLEKMSKEEMDPLIHRCCKTFTYLEASDTLFRDRLVFSLTTKDKSARRRDRLAAKNRTAGRTDGQQGDPKIPSSEEEKEPHYDESEGYSPRASRPAEPARELSNMSTTSTSMLTAFQ